LGELLKKDHQAARWNVRGPVEQLREIERALRLNEPAHERDDRVVERDRILLETGKDEPVSPSVSSTVRTAALLVHRKVWLS